MEAETLRNELLPAIERWRAAGEQIAVATVVRVLGTAPRKEGAKLACTLSGEVAGSVSGGCVEGAVIEEAARVLKSGRPALLGYGITADMITDVGLSCGGQISVFVEPLDAAPDIYSRLIDLLEANKPAAVATVITGKHAGAKLLVPGTGPVTATLPELVALAEADAREALAEEENTIATCDLLGEKADVFIETFPPPERLIIVGAVHVAIPLHRMAKMLGYHVTVVDARGILATPERFPQADRVMVEWPDDAMAQLGLDSSTSVVVLAHDPKFDHPALLAALRSKARYIGAIGSKTTNENRMEALREEGVSEEDLARIWAPVGLDLGAETPAEIALSIMGEIVAARYKRSGGHLKQKAQAQQEVSAQAM